MSKYQPSTFEKSWQEKWKKAGLYRVNLEAGEKVRGVGAVRAINKKGKYYLLVELPYPSGDLHMGHWFTFAVTDILGRMKRMQGYNVFFPVGFDAFGLPAENAAIKRGINPREWTYSNIETMKLQFATMGGMHDFEHGVITCDPDYYRWNQWIFTKMFEKGLAYRGKILSNWCPSCQTVLANENVEAGKCWRCGTEVVQKEVDQWMLKITAYAERLIWPDGSARSSLRDHEVAKQSQKQIAAPRKSGARNDKTERLNFVLLHGFTGGPDKNFFPWLREGLAKSGYEVEVPMLPGTDDPDIKNQVDHVLDTCKINENTIILGHSLGSVAALKIAEQKKLKALVFAAGFAQPVFKDKKRPFEEKFDWKFDFSKIKENVGEVIMLRDKNDSAVPEERADYIKKQIGGKIIDFKSEADHITGEQEPEVLKALDTLATSDTRDPAERDLSTLKLDWPQAIRDGQNNWIGKSEGIEIDFPLVNLSLRDHEVAKQSNEEIATGSSSPRNDGDGAVRVFTTRPDTLYGATFLVLAPEHPMVEELTKEEHKKAVDDYVVQAKKKSELERKELKEKTGIFTGSYVKNPVNGKEVPVWVADYVLWGYGTGAIMAVPAHDGRDNSFVHEVIREDLTTYIKEVVLNPVGKKLEMGDVTLYEGKGKIINSGDWNGWDSSVDMSKVIDWIEEKGIGKREVQYHLHDWSISRQRYWGTPIPMIFCANCENKGIGYSSLSPVILSSAKGGSEGSNKRDSSPALRGQNDIGSMPGWFPVPDDQLPVVLPEISNYAPEGKPPLATADEWVNVKCPNCGGDAKREVDTMDTFVDSSWYFLAYLSDTNEKFSDENPKSEIRNTKQIPNSKFQIPNKPRPWNPEYVKNWMPADLYVGGAEHTLGHTLYSRFFYKFLIDIGAVPFDPTSPRNAGLHSSPRLRMTSRGAGEYAYKRIHHGVILGTDGARMSKSKGNVVNPDEQVAQFGADAVRMYLAFMGPYDLVAPWNPNGLRGVYHFLQRVWELSGSVSPKISESVSRKTSGSVSKNTESLSHRITDTPTHRLTEYLSPEDLYWLHKTIKKVGDDIADTKYNTAVAALMEWMNYLGRKAHEEGIKGNKSIKSIKGGVTVEEYKTMLLLLAPFAPHMTEELWQKLEVSKVAKVSKASKGVKGETTSETSETFETFETSDSIHVQTWPEYDEKYIVQENITIVVQVNGKVRDQLLVEADLGQQEIEKLALGSAKVQNFLGTQTPRKVIYVPNKLVNLVV